MHEEVRIILEQWSRQYQRVKWLRQCSLLLFVLSITSLVSIGLSVLWRGTELGAVFELIVWLMQPIIGLVIIFLAIGWMSVHGLIEHIDQSMEELRRSEVRFRQHRERSDE